METETVKLPAIGTIVETTIKSLDGEGYLIGIYTGDSDGDDTIYLDHVAKFTLYSVHVGSFDRYGIHWDGTQATDEGCMFLGRYYDTLSERARGLEWEAHKAQTAAELARKTADTIGNKLHELGYW